VSLSSTHRPRAFVLLAAAVLLSLLPAGAVEARGGPPEGTPPSLARTAHEVWSLDQGTDLIHVHDSRADLAEVAAIDVSPETLRAAGFAAAPAGVVTVPHMIEFDSQGRYAFIASTSGGVTIVVDARAKQVVAVLPTGPGTHMASITPDDGEVWVSVLGPATVTTPEQQAQRALVQITFGNLDRRDPGFAIGARVEVKAALDAYLAGEEVDASGWAPFIDHRPVCHQFTPDGREAWVTLGPGWNNGGLFVLDLDTHEVSAAWDPGVVKANCGVGVNADGSRVIANWSGRVEAGNDGEGEWYVFDAASKQLLQTESARGLDAHGVRFTRDGRHIWAVNRNSDNALVIDATTFEVVREYEAFADTPDILDFAPDDSVLYVTQRGPTPVSGAPHAATGETPGVLVASTDTGEAQRLLAPPVATRASDGAVINDIHGVGVRALSRAEVAGGLPRVTPPPGRVLVRDVPAATAESLAFTCHIAG
jgi:DNA-binding beta-propeller fold protein YncE